MKYVFVRFVIVIALLAGVWGYSWLLCNPVQPWPSLEDGGSASADHVPTSPPSKI